MTDEQSTRAFLFGVLVGSVGGLVLGSIVTALSVDRLASATELVLRRLLRRRDEFRFDLMVQ